jgi:hypothetical protein
MRTSIFLALAEAHVFAVMDLLYLVLIAGLFLLSIWMIRAFDRM